MWVLGTPNFQDQDSAVTLIQQSVKKSYSPDTAIHCSVDKSILFFGHKCPKIHSPGIIF